MTDTTNTIQPTTTDPTKDLSKRRHTSKELLEDRALAKSWQDEVWTIVLVVPIVIAFVPGLQGVAERGMHIISTAPAWYVVMASVGLAYAFHRKVFSLFGLMKGASK